MKKIKIFTCVKKSVVKEEKSADNSTSLADAKMHFKTTHISLHSPQISSLLRNTSRFCCAAGSLPFFTSSLDQKSTKIRAQGQIF